MDTREILQALKLTAQLMDLHNENSFKSSAIANAAYKLGKAHVELDKLSLAEMEANNLIGKSIAAKIHELQTTGKLAELEALRNKTPEGIIEMLPIKGIGPKKIAAIWKELEIESVGELLYACHENRLVTLKGFGLKTQEQIKKSIEFSEGNVGKLHYSYALEIAEKIISEIKKRFSIKLISITGELRRKNEVVDAIEILVGQLTEIDLSDFEIAKNVTVNLMYCTPENYFFKLFETTGNSIHVSALKIPEKKYFSEAEIYESQNVQFIEPELREGNDEIELARENKIPKLIEFKDLKGIIHNHTTYSDGTNTLREMAEYAKELGYEYLTICDHSKSAVYANGLSVERVMAQFQEIDNLNKELFPFKIFKGIESDILGDGSLDYDEKMLAQFDIIVASVHSNLKMDEEKATQRLLKAIENPYITILGHPTGRLLLSRPGYPLDMKKIIDACAENKVIIELNAHPFRLDIDWRWIRYCTEKGVKISINPDAHYKGGYHDMKYGIGTARKGMLTKENCFNAFSLTEIETYLSTLKNSRNAIKV
ncbi:MAG TPA: PHP domain-containing protein [Bacteroidia bacterium]|nr:PHP domain-containing protein [Bacteroidia bacterium]